MMSHVDDIPQDEFLVIVNMFWLFYKQHAVNYPGAFKQYLSSSKYYNRIVYVSYTDTWTLLKLDYTENFSYKQLKKSQDDPNQ